MSALTIDLERIQIRLKGVSSNTVQEALSGLEEELARRLQGVKTTHSDIFANGMRLTPLEVSPHIRARDMRALLVDHIVAAIEQTERGGQTA